MKKISELIAEEAEGLGNEIMMNESAIRSMAARLPMDGVASLWENYAQWLDNRVLDLLDKLHEQALHEENGDDDDEEEEDLDIPF